MNIDSSSSSVSSPLCGILGLMFGAPLECKGSPSFKPRPKAPFWPGLLVYSARGGRSVAFLPLDRVSKARS